MYNLCDVSRITLLLCVLRDIVRRVVLRVVRRGASPSGAERARLVAAVSAGGCVHVAKGGGGVGRGDVQRRCVGFDKQENQQCRG